jgi:hypothetical protein
MHYDTSSVREGHPWHECGQVIVFELLGLHAMQKTIARFNEVRDTWRKPRQEVYGAQIIFADPCNKLEVAVWEECLKAMCQEFGVSDMNDESALPELLVALRAKDLCIRTSCGLNKAGTDMYMDVFDVSPQVNDAGPRQYSNTWPTAQS